MLFSQRIIIGTASLLLVDYSYIPFNVLTATTSVSAVLCHFKWALNTKPNSPENVLNWNHIQWQCSDEFCLLTLPYTTQKLEHAIWNNHILWQHINQVNRLLIIWRDCIYVKIYHIEWSQEIPKFHMYMEAQDVEYPLPWSCQISPLWSHLVLGSSCC